MKLALVRRSFSPVGGAELYLNRLVDGLARAGHETHLLSESWSESGANLHVHRLPVRGSRATRPREFAEAVERHLAGNRYDCVFSLERTIRQDIYRAGDGVHRVWLEQRRKYLPWWRTFWTSRFHRTMLELEAQTLSPLNTRFIIVNSEMVRNELQRCYPFPSDRAVLIRNGINVDRMRSGRREETRAKYGLRENDFVCLFAGSGWERKGLNFVVRAPPEAQRRIDAEGGRVRLKLIVAGKGRPFSAGSDVIFTGAVPDVENLYAAADLFTFVPIYEPSANVCIEALAAGLPVITSRFNGAAELLTTPDRGSVIVDPADTVAIGAEIARWAGMPVRPRVQVPAHELSIDRNVAETLQLIERVVATK